jgi:hypothetical protein
MSLARIVIRSDRSDALSITLGHREGIVVGPASIVYEREAVLG